MARTVQVEIKLSASAQPFLVAALDLYMACLEADPMLTTDEIKEKTEALRAVVEQNRGDL